MLKQFWFSSALDSALVDSGEGDTSSGSAPSDTGDTGSPAPDDGDGDGFIAALDCDDTNPEVHPGAPEVCDLIDNDCDGLVDDLDGDLDLDTSTTWYGDADDDGWGIELYSVTSCVAPDGYVEAAEGLFDCDDTDPAFHPEAPETDCADPADYNCDGSVGYLDADGDGWAACEECHDLDPDIHPGATEVCDSADNDCDGLRDDEDDSLDPDSRRTFYTDGDGDGYGDVTAPVMACDVPSGAVDNDEDCDDGDPALSPETVWNIDYDGDGYGTSVFTTSACDPGPGWVSDTTDCDDMRADVHPGGIEFCDEGDVDEDCDGAADDGDVDGATGKVWAYTDGDADGYGSSSTEGVEVCDMPAGMVADSTDCDDGDGSLGSSLADADCDGFGAGSDCNDGDPTIYPGATDAWYDGVDSDCAGDYDFDADGDGSVHVSHGGDDCDDGDPSIYPGGADAWYDGVDSDCAGDADFDADADGAIHIDHGGSDCDDTDSLIYLGAPDTWYDGVDSDCGGDSDYDADGDGHNHTDFDGDDCDDGDFGIHPGAADAWYDGVDSDCGGGSDYDADGDGYLHDAFGGDDCDDFDASIHPDAPDLGDGIDRDCGGPDIEIVDTYTGGGQTIYKFSARPLPDGMARDWYQEICEAAGLRPVACDWTNWGGIGSGYDLSSYNAVPLEKGHYGCNVSSGISGLTGWEHIITFHSTGDDRGVCEQGCTISGSPIYPICTD